MARLARFRCWWCRCMRASRHLHHDVVAADGATTRRCCVVCYHDYESNYRSVYPGGEAQERTEVARVQLRKQRSW